MRIFLFRIKDHVLGRIFIDGILLRGNGFRYYYREWTMILAFRRGHSGEQQHKNELVKFMFRDLHIFSSTPVGGNLTLHAIFRSNLIRNAIPRFPC